MQRCPLVDESGTRRGKKLLLAPLRGLLFRPVLFVNIGTTSVMEETENIAPNTPTSKSDAGSPKRKINSINNNYCSVPQCSNYGGPQMHLHRFPKTENMREAWKIILRMGKTIRHGDRVCGEHFLPSDYIPQAKPSKRRYLKKNYLPSQKLPLRTHDLVDSSPKKRSKERRRERAEARALLTEMRRSSAINISPISPVNSVSDSDEIENNIADSNDELPLNNEAENSTSPPKTRDASCQTDRFSLLTLLSDSSKLYTFTGISRLTTIERIAECVEKITPDWGKMLLHLKERVVLCLVKLKLNISYAALSILFGISIRTCSNYFRDTIRLLAKVLKKLVKVPSKEETLKNMPKCFRRYWKTRIVLDCVEVPLEKLKCLKERIMTYSHYKKRHTAKFAVGVSPGGLIISISPAYGGRTSDKKIVVDSGILDELDFGDGVMVDKGFMIEDECLARGLLLYRPAFLSKKKKLSKAEALETAQIASARVHVERVIKQLRDFDILSDQISSHLLPYIDDILLVCAALVNLGPPILALDKF